MTSFVLVAVAWVVLALPTGLVIGRGMRIADGRDEAARAQSAVPDFIPDEVLASVAAEHRSD